MNKSFSIRRRIVVAVVLATLLSTTCESFAGTLRIATYNIDADTFGALGDAGGPISGPGLTTVLKAIGDHQLAGNAQPLDVLALQELYFTPTTTLDYIVGQLNGIYGNGTYAYDATLDPTTGNTTGNGPSAIIYNTKTVQDLGAVHIGSASTSGAARAPMRYELQPVAGDNSSQFYLYVSHAKSGTQSSDANRRNVEANELRTDVNNNLGAGAHVIYAGDFNVTSSSEAAYQTLISSALYSGVGQASDVPNPANNWTASATFKSILTESATDLRFRDDFQFATAPILGTTGFHLIPNTYSVFGNNGTTAFGGRVDASGNTSLIDLPNEAAVRSALTTATDHLPVVADYAFANVPEPSSFLLASVAVGALFFVRRYRSRHSR